MSGRIKEGALRSRVEQEDCIYELNEQERHHEVVITSFLQLRVSVIGVCQLEVCYLWACHLRE